MTMPMADIGKLAVSIKGLLATQLAPTGVGTRWLTRQCYGIQAYTESHGSPLFVQ